MSKKIYKILSLLLCLCLVFEQAGFAQSIGQLDISGYLTSLRNNINQDKFRPLHLRYLAYDALNNNFNLLVDKGNILPEKTDLEDAARALMNYFFVGLTLPNDTFWVNLRPDAETNIIGDELAKTDIGRIMLEADVWLKKDTARYTSPNTPEGKEYWGKLYKKAGEIFGYDNVQIPTLTRPWIVPDEILIGEIKSGAYIFKATLKVMLEQDYLKGSAVYNFSDERLKTLNEYSSQLIRELIIPKITQEVNSAKRYAPLRQVYYSLILAQWFKAKSNGKTSLYDSLIDRRNLSGLDSKTSWSITTYFKEYQKSFKNGEYNTSESVYTPYGQTIRSYFSGGIKLVVSSSPANNAFPADTIPAEGKHLVAMKYDDKTGAKRVAISSSPTVPPNSEEELLNGEPQLRQDNPYGMALRRFLDGPEVTQESIKRRRILNQIGSEAERNVQALYGNPNVKIVIAPHGSTLKGYADEKSDVEYAIYIVSGAEKEPTLDRSPRRIRIHEEINGLINGLQEGVKAEDKIAVLPVMNLSGITGGEGIVSLPEELDAWYLMHLFLPVEYGDSSLIEQFRKNIIAYFLRKGQEGQEAWRSIQRVYAEYVAIREGDVSLKPHLRNWLARQGVTSLEDFNKARSVGLPDLEEMGRIYGILLTLDYRSVSSPTQLSLDEKIRLVSQKHEHSYNAIQREHNLDPLIYSISDPEGAKDTISWLFENGYLDSSKKFCDPFMGNGLLAHLAHVMTGADSTGYEKDPRIHQEAVRISTELSKLDVVDPERIHFILGDSSSVSLKQYDVFYILPPWEDGIPNPMLVWDVITDMKIGAIMVLTTGIDPTSIYYSHLHLEDYIEKIADIKGGVVYRRISSASSPTQLALDAKGGIDFRTLPIVNTAINNLKAANGSIPNLDLTSEWREIERLAQLGISPSGERIKGYLQASCYEGKIIQDKKIVIACISDILRQQEEHYVSTDPMLRDILIVLESNRSLEDFRAIFINVKP